MWSTELERELKTRSAFDTNFGSAKVKSVSSLSIKLLL